MNRQQKLPKNSKEFIWTNHALNKMRQYGISEQKVRGVVFRPNRKEEGIAPKTIAIMQKSGSQKRPYEIWVMYQVGLQKESSITHHSASIKNQALFAQPKKIISAWKYPGISPKKNPISEAILRELEQVNE